MGRLEQYCVEVVNSWRNAFSVEDDPTLDDTEFHAHATVIGNVWSPIVDRRVEGTVCCWPGQLSTSIGFSGR